MIWVDELVCIDVCMLSNLTTRFSVAPRKLRLAGLLRDMAHSKKYIINNGDQFRKHGFNSFNWISICWSYLYPDITEEFSY